MHRSLLAAVIALPLFSTAQENVGGTPFSVRYGLLADQVPTAVAEPFDQNAVASEDAQREVEGKLPLYGRLQEVHRGPHNAGLWTELGGGDRLWRLRLESPGALATELFFENFSLPANAVLYVYSPDGMEVLGGFTAYNNHQSGLFTTALISGSVSMVEYFEPAGARGLGTFTITSVGHAYRMVGSAKADPCEVDLMCSEGDGWREEGDGVVRISVVGPGGTGWCSGSLVNNTALDCKPYFLTALHCGEGSTTANFNQYKFYFRYMRNGCDSGTALANKVMTGCTRLADSNCGGGDNGSDFLLVEANNDVPGNFFPWFNGWDVSGTGSSSGACIHHPAGDEKKISTYTSNLMNATWGGAPGSHWRVTWSATANGWGVTEGGSSGSPIFNSAQRIIGTLTGGGSCCTTNGCGGGTGPTAPDFYGKMSYHWGSQNPNPSNEELEVWLDPAGTGALTLDGMANPCGVISVNELTSAEPKVYPNPADRSVTVELSEDITVEGIVIRDVAGRVVLSKAVRAIGRLVVSTAELAEGPYVLQLQYDGELITAGTLIVRH